MTDLGLKQRHYDNPAETLTSVSRSCRTFFVRFLTKCERNLLHSLIKCVYLQRYSLTKCV